MPINDKIIDHEALQQLAQTRYDFSDLNPNVDNESLNVIYKHLVDSGYDDRSAAMMMGSIIDRSGGDPYYQGADGKSNGLLGFDTKSQYRINPFRPINKNKEIKRQVDYILQHPEYLEGSAIGPQPKSEPANNGGIKTAEKVYSLLSAKMAEQDDETPKIDNFVTWSMFEDMPQKEQKSHVIVEDPWIRDITNDILAGEGYLYDKKGMAGRELYADPYGRFFATKGPSDEKNQVDPTYKRISLSDIQGLLPKRDSISGSNARMQALSRIPGFMKAVYDRANTYGVDPNVVLHRFAKEGFADSVIRAYNKAAPAQQKTYFTDSHLWNRGYNGHEFFGLDDAGQNLLDGKYTLKDENATWSTLDPWVNELGRTVHNTPYLDNLSSAIEVMAAELAYRQGVLKKRGITDDIRDYVNASYNAGLYSNMLKNPTLIHSRYKVPDYYSNYDFEQVNAYPDGGMITPAVKMAHAPDIRTAQGKAAARNMAEAIAAGQYKMQNTPMSYRNYISGELAGMPVTRAIDRAGKATAIGLGAAAAAPYAISAATPVINYAVDNILPYAFGAGKNPVIQGMVNIAETADAINNLSSDNGIKKTVGFVKDGRYGRAAISGLVDLMDVAGTAGFLKDAKNAGQLLKNYHHDAAKFGDKASDIIVRSVPDKMLRRATETAMRVSAGNNPIPNIKSEYKYVKASGKLKERYKPVMEYILTGKEPEVGTEAREIYNTLGDSELPSRYIGELYDSYDSSKGALEQGDYVSAFIHGTPVTRPGIKRVPSDGFFENYYKRHPEYKNKDIRSYVAQGLEDVDDEIANRLEKVETFDNGIDFRRGGFNQAITRVNVAGHNLTIYRDPKTGLLYKQGHDLWKFNPEEYSKKWQPSGTSELTPITATGLGVVDKLGTPIETRTGFIPLSRDELYDLYRKKRLKYLKEYGIKLEDPYAVEGAY